MIQPVVGKVFCDELQRRWKIISADGAAPFAYIGIQIDADNRPVKTSQNGPTSVHFWDSLGKPSGGLDSMALLKESRDARVVHVRYNAEGHPKEFRTPQAFLQMSPDEKKDYVKFVEVIE